MHYYQFNIGDYQTHTNHLDPIEDIAYRRMLDWCYIHEAPLPKDVNEIARLIRMRDNAPAIRDVLNEFFEPLEDGWFSSRVQREIDHYKAKVEQASRAGKASAERRFNKSSTDVATDVQPTNNQEPITNNQVNLPSVSVDVAVNAPRRIPCPADEILSLYHEHCPTLQRVMMLNDTRRRHLISRWREVETADNIPSKHEGLEIFEQIFKRVSKSDFLTGRTQNRNSRHWKATFDWLMLPTNFLKVCEGQYDNGRN